jgi:hypothetical protein
VFEKIVRKGIDNGVFSDVEPKLFALNALFLCHLWSLHTRALRSITQNIDEFFDMQSKIMLQGLLKRGSNLAIVRKPKAKRAARAAGIH